MEIVPVTLLNGQRAEVDILYHPNVDHLKDLSVAIEIKACFLIEDGALGPWIKQTADYVGASPINGKPTIVAGFVWLADAELTSSSQEKERINGMFQLAQHFRVGHASIVGRCGLCMVFGPSAEVFRESKGGWLPRARQLLLAKRQSGGTRKSLVSTLARSTSTVPSFEFE